MKKVLMSGNEAIARGVYEAGVRFAAAYPGTPSTEIMEEFAGYEGVYAEWTPNEKVAVEVAIGAALSGAKALAVMKHVGVNVAADPIFTVSYTGIEGALVIVSADDPSMHSSQNEQDNRNYAKFAKIPMLEPSDPQEAKDFVGLAFQISSLFDTPVFFRTTTRVSHSKSVVTLSDIQTPEDKTGLTRNALKYGSHNRSDKACGSGKAPEGAQGVRGNLSRKQNGNQQHTCRHHHSRHALQLRPRGVSGFLLSETGHGLSSSGKDDP